MKTSRQVRESPKAKEPEPVSKGGTLRRWGEMVGEGNLSPEGSGPPCSALSVLVRKGGKVGIAPEAHRPELVHLCGPAEPWASPWEPGVPDLRSPHLAPYMQPWDEGQMYILTGLWNPGRVGSNQGSKEQLEGKR